MLGCLTAVPAQAATRSRLDARIDALTPAALLSANPVLLVDPARQRRARALADLRHVASAGWGLAQIFAYWWLWRSGAGARVRDAMRRRTRNRLAQRAVFGALLGALGPLAALPFALMSYRLGFGIGLTAQTLGAWLAGYAGRIALDALLGAIIVAGVLTLVERVRVWYLIVAAIFYAGAMAAVMVEPVLPLGPAHKVTPRAVAALGERIASAVGVPGTPVMVTATSRRTNALSMRSGGIGPTARVVLGDNDFLHLTPGELAVAIAHGDEHVRFGDAMRQTLFAVTLFVLSAAFAVLASDRVGFRRDDDALSRLALVATFLGIALAFTYPLYNAYARNLETRADRSALAVLPDRADIVRTFVRLADLNLIPLCDRRSIRWYFDDRPAMGGRIAQANGTADPCPGGGPATKAAP